MQAVIQTGGKQYLVAKGDRILIEKLEGDKGAKVSFDQILMINNNGLKLGQPLVAGAMVTATIVEQHKTKKVIVYKYKRRKGYHKKQGHRQNLTRVEIADIQG